MAKVEKSTVQLIIDGQQSKTSLKEMGSAVRQLKMELRDMKEADDPKAWMEKTQEVQKATKAYADAKDRIAELTQTGKEFKSGWKDIFKGFLGANLVTQGLDILASAATKVKDKIYDLSDSLADLGKATNLNGKDLRDLNSDLSKLDTRTLNEDLRDIGVIAGKNGIQKDLAGFVKSTDMINVAFGDEFDSVTELTEGLVNVRKIFSDIQSDDVGQDVLHIGNAMNYLADAGTASGKVMLDFSSRMGGVLIPLGVTSGQILGLATTMEELSITAERGSTAINTVFQKMLTNVDAFAKVAGVSSKEFAHDLNTDIFAAFNKFIKGASASGAQATEFAKILEYTELSGSGASEVLLKLSSNQDMLAKYVGAATEKLKESSAITTEFNKKNNNAAAIIDKLGKIADNTFERMAMWGMDMVEAYGPWLLSLGNVTIKITEQRALWQTLATILLVYYANTIKATAVTIANTTAQIANRIAVAASVPLYSLAATGVRLMTIQHQLLTGQITISTAATRVAGMATKSLNAIWLANPLGVVIAGIAAFVGALKLYSDNTKEAIELEKNKHKLSVQLAKSTSENEKAQSLLNDRIADYNTLSASEQENLRNEIILRRQKLASQLKNIEAQRVELSQQAGAPSIFQKFVGILKGTAMGGGTQYAAEMASAAADNMQQVNEQFNGQIDNLKKSLDNYDRMSSQMDRMDKSKLDAAAAAKNAKLHPIDFDADDNKKKKKTKEDTMFADRLKFQEAEEKYDKERADEKQSYADAEAKYDKKRLDDLKEFMDAEEEYDQMMAERAAGKQLDLTNNALSMGEATGQITPDAANRAKLDAEEAYLTELLLIRQSYGKETGDIEQQLADASIKRAADTFKSEKEFSEKQKEAAFNLQSAKAEALEQGAAALMGFFKESSAIYKALFLVEKAAAIANIIIKTQQEIAAISLAYAEIPGGQAIAAALIVAAKVRAGIGIGTIAAQTVQSFIPGREDGGYTDLSSLKNSKSPAGYVNQPTLFNLGARSFIAGEKYKKEYVVSNDMLQDPVIRATTQQMELMRTTGQRPGSLSSGGGGADLPEADQALQRAIHDEIRGLRVAMQSGDIKLVFNYREFEKYKTFIDFIKSETSL